MTSLNFLMRRPNRKQRTRDRQSARNKYDTEMVFHFGIFMNKSKENPSTGACKDAKHPSRPRTKDNTT